MNIRIAKGERFIKLTKRERDLLKDAKSLLVELAKQDVCTADMAADKIGEVERELDTPTPVAPPY